MATSPSGFGSFLTELKRRHVVRVAVVYAVVAWAIIQVADTVLPRLGQGDWTVTLVIVLVLLGFPIAVVLAWAFEVTPDGVRWTEPLTPEDVGHQGGGLATLQRTLRYGGIGLLFILLPVGVHWHRARSATHDGPIGSIAVLPFLNMSADADQEHFSDGISEELIDALAQVPGLNVAARTSSFRFKGEGADVREVGRQLRVEAVIEGSVRRSGNQLRIAAQLIRTSNGYHLWSKTFDRELSDVFAVQQEIAAEIVGALGERVRSRGGSFFLARGQTHDPEAYDLYLRGRHALRRQTAEGLELAIRYFNQAVERDPAYAGAQAGLAEAYVLLGGYGYVPEAEAFPLAKAAAESALEREEGLAEAHAARAYVLVWERRFEGAEDAFKRAIELNPNYATARHWYAGLLMLLGRTQDAVAESRRAQELDPLSLPIVPLTDGEMSSGSTYQPAVPELRVPKTEVPTS